MPVFKHRSVEGMKPRERRPLDPENLRVAFSLAATAYWLHPWRFPPGVHKNRSIEEANRRRHEWVTASAREPPGR
jgi:hypothetical protein